MPTGSGTAAFIMLHSATAHLILYLCPISMAVYYDINKVPTFTNAVITIGAYDGVHDGHKAILRKVAARAREVNGESILITFEPHPRKLLFPDKPLGIITPLAEKIDYALETGIEHIVVAPFTREFSAMSAHDYIEQFLARVFKPHTIIIGYDHRFGHDRAGGIELLIKYAPEYGYELIEIPAQLIDEAAVSSTKIRNAIREGNMQLAAHMLGRPYSVAGTVAHGAKLGRTIGYPTANLNPAEPDQLLPCNGVYAILATHNGRTHKGMASIGYNPTVTDKKELRIEGNLFDFASEIYGDAITFQFIKRLRDEQKFDSLAALTHQLHLDKENTLEVLA